MAKTMLLTIIPTLGTERWSSPLVVHYAGEAMPTGLAQDIRTAASAAPADSAAVAALRRFTDRLE